MSPCWHPHWDCHSGHSSDPGFNRANSHGELGGVKSASPTHGVCQSPRHPIFPSCTPVMTACHPSAQTPTMRQRTPALAKDKTPVATWPASQLRGKCSHSDAWDRVCLTSGHLLGTGEDERAPQEEVEVKHVGHLIGSHQRVGSAAPASSGHTTWQGEKSEIPDPACPHPGRDPLVPLGAHTRDVYQGGMAGKGLWVTGQGGKGKVTLVPSYREDASPAPKSPHSQAGRSGTFLPLLCHSLSPRVTTWRLPRRYHHQVRGISASPTGHRDGKNRGQGTAHPHPPHHPEGPPGCKDPCVGHRHPPTRCRNSLALAGKL